MQAITAVNFNHICTAFDFDDFYENKCKDFLVEINNGNIFNDVGQKRWHVLGNLIL
jgi:hypothetical protein